MALADDSELGYRSVGTFHRPLGVSLSSLQTLGSDDVEPQLDLPI
jgi:hypothetical protein